MSAHFHEWSVAMLEAETPVATFCPLCLQLQWNAAVEPYYSLRLCWIPTRRCPKLTHGVCLSVHLSVCVVLQCVPDSRLLPLATISVVKDHPEMSSWVHPKDERAPFYISSNIYTKIVVDKVQAADQHSYSVLFLSTGMVKTMQFPTLLCYLHTVLSCLFCQVLFTVHNQCR